MSASAEESKAASNPGRGASRTIVTVDGRTQDEWNTIRKECLKNPDYIHPVEEAALKELKEAYPISNDPFFSDNYLYACLFARKLDVKRTAELLQNNLEWRKKNDYINPLRINDLKNHLVRSAFLYSLDGVRDNQGRYVIYMESRKYFPKQYSVKDVLDQFMWQFDRLLRIEPLDIWREGFTYVYDLKGWSFTQNFDRKMSRATTLAIQNNFPFRVRSVLLIHTGLFTKVFLNLLKVLRIRKKIMSRIECVKPRTVLERANRGTVPSTFGGDYIFDYTEYIAHIADEEDETFGVVIGANPLEKVRPGAHQVDVERVLEDEDQPGTRVRR